MIIDQYIEIEVNMDRLKEDLILNQVNDQLYD
jgi:hypothetical protein